MKRQLLLTLQLLDEYGSWIGCTSTTKDQTTILRRVEHEGYSFLTITLPIFAADFQKSLERGWVANTEFRSFKKSRCLPAFLQGFTSLVFDDRSGLLLREPSTTAIDAIRQICLLHQKLLLDTTSERTERAMDGYLECENHVRSFDQKRSDLDLELFERASSVIFGPSLLQLDKEVWLISDHIRPKHGPGATADRRRGNQKWLPSTWTVRLESIFPARDFLIPSERYYEELDSMVMIEPGDEMPVRVISVPKTLKTPRIIAIEPTCMQYVQQSLSRRLVDLLEKQLQGMVGFTDQMPNRHMARQGSIDRSLATIDLSSASDLVSNQLVRSMFRRYGNVQSAVDACRSRKADVPGRGVVRLAKFASMGSALCFPVEAMVFLTIVFMAIAAELKTSVTPRLIEEFRGRVRVYGDDIIVPRAYVTPVINLLEAHGLIVGLDKSFWNGRFRESCGGDYYDGEDVTPIRCRREFPASLKDAEEVISWVAMRNLFYNKGLWMTARWIDDQIGSVLKHFPIVEPTSSVIGRDSVAFSYVAERDDPRLHAPLVKGYVSQSVLPSNSIDGPAALLKWFLSRGEEPLQTDHLERSGRPGAVRLKPRWASPF